MDRRQFLSCAAALPAAAAGARPVRFGIIGTGGRGTNLMRRLLEMPGVEVRAVCDTDPNNLLRAQEVVEKACGKRPEGYGKDPEAFRQVNVREDLDAVLIATPWNWHAPMAVDAMKRGKYVALEVPAALTIDECWDLVNTSESTGMPCMMLENWSFLRRNLAALKMIRQGLMGRMVHCHCAHSHDCTDHWYFDVKTGQDRWPAEFLVKRNADQYPTHSLGPVMSWMDINCGDAFATATSTATDSRGINDFFKRKFGPNHPGAKRKYAQGDIVTTVVRTHMGRTIVINYDMQLPRPYDNRWMIQGSLGVYDEARESIYLSGRNPKIHRWEPFAPYQDKFDHAWWRGNKAAEAAGPRKGTEPIELERFVEAVCNRTQTCIDVYDSVTMSVIIPLSEQSIAKGSAPVECPDFTRGKWKTRKPVFALEG